MSQPLLASIIINNYNYDKYLSEAIDSALSQTYANVEVIVVDDGSTDRSREIIMNYGKRVIPVFKSNGGQASAFNSGFEKSTGDVIIFLDSDDVLYSTALQKIMPLFDAETIAKVHWPLSIINATGNPTGAVIPKATLPEGNFRIHGMQSGPPFFMNPPTSGNAWSRQFIQTIIPIPEHEFKIGADTYLFEMVTFFGQVKRINEVQGSYRIHDKNNYNNKSFNQKLQSELLFYETLFPILNKYCETLGLPVRPKLWREKSWFHRLSKAVQEIKNAIPERNSIILVDDATWDIGDTWEGRTILPFLEIDKIYAGTPRDDSHAITELNRMLEMGVNYIVFAWVSFWWLQFYPQFHEYLRRQSTCVLDNDELIIFNLKNSS